MSCGCDTARGALRLALVSLVVAAMGVRSGHSVPVVAVGVAIMLAWAYPQQLEAQ